MVSDCSPEQPVGDGKEPESGLLEYRFEGENSPALKIGKYLIIY
jgi:hypothetical protein